MRDTRSAGTAVCPPAPTGTAAIRTAAVATNRNRRAIASPYRGGPAGSDSGVAQYWPLRSRAMRSAVGGCVLNRLANSHLATGERVHDVGLACAGGTSIGTCFAYASIFSSARASPRRRATGARRSRRPGTHASARATSATDRPRSERGSTSTARRTRCRGRRRHRRRTAHPRTRTVATNVIASATAAATDPMRMSRFFTCESSWARTPRSSSRSRTWRMPRVTTTAAWFGLRPVAKALGCASVGHVDLGHRHARLARELLDDRVDLGKLLAGHRHRPRRLDRELVAEPVGASAEQEGEPEPDDEPGGAAQQRPDAQEQGTQERQEDGRLQCVSHLFHLTISLATRRDTRLAHAAYRPGSESDTTATLRRTPTFPKWRSVSRSTRSGCRCTGRLRSGTSRRCAGRPRSPVRGGSRSGAGPTPRPA